jgi:hypothetical protein
MTTTRNAQIDTPWGLADTTTEYSPGLVFYTTPRHGGFYLSPGCWQAVLAAFPGFQPWAGPQWLEEDCDAVIPPLLWPELFTADAVASAVRFAQSWESANFQPLRTWIFSPAGARVREIARAFYADNAQNWERGSLSCGGGHWGWHVHFNRGAEHRAHSLADYPLKSWYTTAELDAFAAEEVKHPDRFGAPKLTPRPDRTGETWVDSADYSGALGADGMVYSDADPGL